MIRRAVLTHRRAVISGDGTVIAAWQAPGTRVCVTTLLFGFAANAHAHATFDAGGASPTLSLLNGAIHPFVVMQHALLLIAAGLLLGRQQRVTLAHAWLLAIAALAAGLVLARDLTEGTTLMIILALTMGCALTVVISRHPHSAFAVPLVCTAALLVGIDSPPSPDTLLNHDIATRFGTWVSSGAVLFYAALLSSAAGKPWQVIGVRIAASWIAAVCVMLLAFHASR